jgi:hypothetical protein
MDRLGVDADAPRYLTYPERLGLAPPPPPTEGEAKAKAKAPDERTRANGRPLGPPTKNPLSREEARRLAEASIRAAPLVLEEDPAAAAANEDDARSKKASDGRKPVAATVGRFSTTRKSDGGSRPSGFELATSRSRRRPVAARPYDVSVGVEPAPRRTDAEMDAAAGVTRAPGGEVPGGAYRDLDQVD